MINQKVKATNHYICHSPNSKEEMIDDLSIEKLQYTDKEHQLTSSTIYLTLKYFLRFIVAPACSTVCSPCQMAHLFLHRVFHQQRHTPSETKRW